MLEGFNKPTVNGKPNDVVMPKLDFLSDEDIAKVLTYIRLNFNNNAGAIRENEVADIRTKLKDEQINNRRTNN